MGKKDKTGVGRTILKNRNKGTRQGSGKESWLHTSELHDEEDWKLTTQSVTEQSALDEFLTTAELAGTEFIAEKLNVSVITENHRGGLPSAKEEKRIQQVQDEHKKFLQIPRRPPWDKTTTGEQLEQHEKESFLNWRRSLAELQEKDDIILTPFERNLEFWRQLWRVIERSDVIVQIVDARNPLLFRCEDLESYVTEVDSSKASVLLINKADLLTQEQRETWAAYFKKINVKAVFWSAVFETERLKQLKTLEETVEQKSEPQSNPQERPQAVLDEGHGTNFLDLNDEANFDESDDKEVSVTSEHDANYRNPNLVVVPPKESSSIDPDFGGSRSRKTESSDCGAAGRDLEEHHPVENESWDCEPVEESLIGAEQTASPSDVDGNCAEESEGSLPLAHVDETFSELPVSNNEDCTVDAVKNSASDGQTGKASSVQLSDEDSVISDGGVTRIDGKVAEFYTSGHLLTGEELLGYCRWLHQRKNCETKHGEDVACTVIGLVGYPNVGKSSTINAILQAKKVPVSATPGRTKHFQTLFVDKNICLCDCPGLVFPSFVSTKAEMVVSGILPIDQMRDHVAPVSLVCRRIPRSVLETVYGFNLAASEDDPREPYAEELLNAYGYSKGYMTSQGRPDCPRSARYILKDYVSGRLLYCHAPPGHEADIFQASFTGNWKPVKKRPPVADQKSTSKADKLDKDFFKKDPPKSFTHATTGTEEYRRLMSQRGQSADSHVVLIGKPWKKHGNRNKKEKIRRLHPRDF